MADVDAGPRIGLAPFEARSTPCIENRNANPGKDLLLGHHLAALLMGIEAHLARAGFFDAQRRRRMANHLTPEELAKELNMDREAVIRLCVSEGVPIYQGKIDKYLFQAQLQAAGATPQAATA